MKNNYIKNLENVIKQMLTPLKNIPLNLVIEAISGYSITPFDKDNEQDKIVLEKLKGVARTAGTNINANPINRPRPNEVGNDIEPFVKEALAKIGYKPKTPLTTTGKRKSTGYPDIEFEDEFGRTAYLECKTYNIENIATTQRSFYLSPSEDFKITKNGHHFVISYEIYVDGRTGTNNVYKCKQWKILSIEKLLVDVKYEFNSDNLRLYAEDLILAEGEL